MNRLVTHLLLVVVAMFGFGFALVPLYDVFCEVTGLNGKTSGERYEYRAEQARVQQERTVKVQFIASNNAGMNWEFSPEVTELRVHPGELVSTHFLARNTEGREMVAQAIPSISPGLLARYFHKTECFCFERQTLAAHSERHMPLRFVVDPHLPEGTHTITLSYTLFDVTDTPAAKTLAAVP